MTEKVFERKIYGKMLAWKKERKGKTALLVNGARRVGKSTIVKTFAEREYASWILIDFAKAPDEVRELFNHLDDLDFVFLRLQSIFHVDLIERKSVIIFDEVQACPQARQAIKYLVEDGRYDYIETGSLLSIRKNTEKILIPSEETRITMFPMDYEEFLWAMGDKQTMPLIRHAFENLRGLGDDMNRRLMRQFRLYMLVGGMPQVVNEYLETNNLAAADAVKREIIELYLDDLRKIDGTDRAARIFRSVPGELAKSKLHYQVGSVIKNAEPARMGHIWQELEDSVTVNFCYRCSDPNVGMALHKDYDKFRIFLGDTGLFVTLAFWDKEVVDNLIYQKLLSDKLSADLGYVYENVVAQSLRASGHSLFYYFFQADAEKKSHYEIDFMLSVSNKIVPIEVKSSGYKTHKSLDVFSQKYSARIGKQILLYTKDLRTEKGVLYLPVYMAGLL